MRITLRLTAITLLIVSGIVLVPKWWNSVRESHLQSRIHHALLDEFPELDGEDWRIYLDGSEGVIHGTVSSQSLFTGVDQLLTQLSGDGPKSIRGLDSIECALSVPHQSSLELSIDDEAGQIQISGEIPAQAITTISAALSSAFPKAEISDHIQLASGQVGKAPWAAEFGEIAPTLVRSIGDLSIKLEGRSITINGRVASEESRNQIQQLLLKRFSGSIDYVRNGLTTLDGQLETSYLTIEFTDADTIVLGGRIQSKTTRDQLVRGIEAIAPAGFLVEDRIKVRPAATGSWWIRPTLAFLPKAFESLHGSDFRVDASGVQIRGMRASADEQRAIDTLAKGYFPDEIYAFTSERYQNIAPSPEIAPTGPLLATTGDTPSEFVEEPEEFESPAPSIDPEGSNDTEDLIAATQIFFASGSTRIRETESEKITRLAEHLTSTPELKLDISGLADPVGNAAANRRLAQKRCTAVLIALEESGIDPSRLQIIGGGEKSPQAGEESWKLRRVEFAITAPELLAANQPRPSADSITTTQIYFEKSSTSLTLEERSKLDRIAALLKEDTPGVLGIAGFTDPHGNRYYNERLSKLRCQAVLVYLVEQGVAESRLKTQPGGELSDTDTDADEPSWKKRRVQFQWLELSASR